MNIHYAYSELHCRCNAPESIQEIVRAAVDAPQSLSLPCYIALGILVSMNDRPRKKIDFSNLREIALVLPDVEEGKMYGSPALKVRGKLLACLPANKQAESDSLAVRIDFDQRAALLAEAPDVYYVTDHYISHPIVLVRMSRISRDALRDLLKAGWRFATSREGKTSGR